MQRIENGNYVAARSDVLPSQRNAARDMGKLSEVQQFKASLVNFSNLQLVNAGAPTGTTKTVYIQGCGADFSCTSVGHVPTVEVHGKWYVSFVDWDAPLPGHASP